MRTLSPEPTKASCRLRRPSSSLRSDESGALGTATRDLPPLGMTQVPSVVTAQAIVTDNITNDPRTVLP